MADEISISVSGSLKNGNLVEQFSSAGRFDQANAVSVGGVVQVGTATQTISLGAVGTAGYAFFRSLSTATSGTAYVGIGRYDGTNVQEFGRLLRNDVLGPVRLAPSVTIGVKGYTASGYTSAIGLQYLILGD